MAQHAASYPGVPAYGREAPPKAGRRTGTGVFFGEMRFGVPFLRGFRVPGLFQGDARSLSPAVPWSRVPSARRSADEESPWSAVLQGMESMLQEISDQLFVITILLIVIQVLLGALFAYLVSRDKGRRR